MPRFHAKRILLLVGLVTLAFLLLSNNGPGYNTHRYSINDAQGQLETDNHIVGVRNSKDRTAIHAIHRPDGEVGDVGDEDEGQFRAEQDKSEIKENNIGIKVEDEIDLLDENQEENKDDHLEESPTTKLVEITALDRIRHDVKDNNAEKQRTLPHSPVDQQGEPSVLHPTKETPSNNSAAEESVDNKEEHVLQVPQEGNQIGPGEMNQPVKIDKNKLTAEEKKEYDEGYKNNAFNEYASNMISLHRSLPDPRHHLCKEIDYPSGLPSTSVIIIFYNEAWSALLRTVHSVLDRSPPDVLKEIILVDDFSTLEHVKAPLDKYLLDYPKVRVLRSKQRDGLIMARMMGARAATGEILVFLDSHCEAMEGWLQPLAYRIYQNWTNVVTPQIDQIDEETFQIHVNPIDPISVGGFNWGLLFNWHAMPARIHRETVIEPAPSPTMAGGLFGISKKYFEYLGMYDPGMFIWGGENLELSFKVWMCGGQLHQIPCSHVAHLFRKRSPYSWTGHSHGNNVLTNNLVRLAEVWLDDYKENYYVRINHKLGEYGDVSERKALRERLQCHSFKWYLDNIYPELFQPGKAIAIGDVANEGGRSMCLDGDVDKRQINNAPVGYRCHGQGGHQFWMLSEEGEIRRDEGCLDFMPSAKIRIIRCHGMGGNQKWTYEQWRGLKHVPSGLCMELPAEGDKLLMNECQPDNPAQKWTWKRNEQKKHS